METKSYYNPDSLYNQCILGYVKHLKPKTTQLDGIDGLQTLPPNILADIYLIVSVCLFSMKRNKKKKKKSLILKTFN